MPLQDYIDKAQADFEAQQAWKDNFWIILFLVIAGTIVYGAREIITQFVGGIAWRFRNDLEEDQTVKFDGYYHRLAYMGLVKTKFYRLDDWFWASERSMWVVGHTARLWIANADLKNKAIERKIEYVNLTEVDIRSLGLREPKG